MMNDQAQREHSEHLEHQQDHYRWRQQHAEAVAILRRAEAAILAHEARMIAHDAEIDRHEEQIAHGDAHAEPPPKDAHAQYANAHQSGQEHHRELLEAIRAIETHLDR